MAEAAHLGGAAIDRCCAVNPAMLAEIPAL
jgi:hypothetical protein